MQGGRKHAWYDWSCPRNPPPLRRTFMSSYSLSHLADHTLLRELAASVSQDRTTTARMLAQIAEVDERRLYLPSGYSSMFLYCLHELRMSEDVAYKRIRAARAARQFPAIFPAVADGR